MNTEQAANEGLSLVEYVNLHRERRGLEWTDVATELGVSVATLYRWRQTSFSDARIHHVQALVDLLDLDAHRVLHLARRAA